MKKFLILLIIIITLSLCVFDDAFAQRGRSRTHSDATAFKIADRVPTLDLDGTGGNYAVTFTEGGSAVAIASTEVDITATEAADLRYIVATITNAKTGDSLDYSGVDSNLVGAVTTGTGTYTLTLTGNGNFAFGTYETALQNIKFTNSSDDPDTTTRTVEVYVSNGNSNSNTMTCVVTVVAVNDAPVLYLGGASTANFSTTYEGAATAIALASTEINITDADDTYMEIGWFKLTNAKTSDALQTSEVDATGRYTVVVDSSTPGEILVTMTGHQTIAQYKADMQLVKFYNALTSEIDLTTREVSIKVSDGTAYSTARTTSIVVSAP